MQSHHAADISCSFGLSKNCEVCSKKNPIKSLFFGRKINLPEWTETELTRKKRYECSINFIGI